MPEISLKRLLLVSRPVTWPVVPLVFFLGLYFSPTGINWTFPFIFQMFALSVPFCFAGYGLNDMYDYESDRINKRKGILHGTILKKHEFPVVRKFIIICSAILILSSLMSGSLINLALLGIIMSAGYIYSAKPFRIKERPPFDSIINSVFYWYGPFFMGYYFFADEMYFSLTVYQVLFVGLAVMACHMFATIPDYNPDKKAGTMTFSVRYGRRVTAIVSSFLVLVVLLFSKISSSILLIYLGIVFLLMLSAVFVRDKKLNIVSLWYMKIIYAFFLIVFIIYILQ